MSSVGLLEPVAHLVEDVVLRRLYRFGWRFVKGVETAVLVGNVLQLEVVATSCAIPSLKNKAKILQRPAALSSSRSKFNTLLASASIPATRSG